MTLRFQRLLLILFSLTLLTFAILLILFNSKKNLIFFYTPTELLESEIQINNKVRIGGFVQNKSIVNNGNNNYRFIITDKINSLNIIYNGLLPDLFKEGQGAVIEGILLKKNTINASIVFAKHDENYMPASIKKQLKINEYWNKNYK
jgi:cytochrome c-type biogenesis protein CcmE